MTDNAVAEIDTQPIRARLVEDNPGDARLLREALRTAGARGFNVMHVERLDEASNKLRTAQFDVLLLDLSLPDSSGLDTVVRACVLAPHTPIVVLTGLDDETLAIEAVRKGAQDYLIKGQTDGPLLVRAVRYALERKRAQEEREHLIRELKEALTTVKRLSGLLPICSSCKRIRDEKGHWEDLEKYIDEHSDTKFSHGLCLDCAKKLYPEYYGEG